jgi:hypothetical protein
LSNDSVYDGSSMLSDWGLGVSVMNVLINCTVWILSLQTIGMDNRFWSAGY